MSAPFKIERGIKMPVPQPKYPLRQMKVGDSFFMPCSAGRNCDRSARTCARQVSQSLDGFRVSIRKVKGGHRVWRIA